MRGFVYARAMSSTPNNTNAMQDFLGMTGWAFLNAEGSAPAIETLASAAAGTLLWQYVGKERAAKYQASLTAAVIKDTGGSGPTGAEQLFATAETDFATGHPAAGTVAAFAALAAADTKKGIAAVEALVEDGLALTLLARPGTYLAALYIGGMISGKKLSLPEYLVIAGAGAATGSMIRQG